MNITFSLIETDKQVYRYNVKVGGDITSIVIIDSYNKKLSGSKKLRNLDKSKKSNLINFKMLNLVKNLDFTKSNSFRVDFLNFKGRKIFIYL